jgi:hypothetical protein
MRVLPKPVESRYATSAMIITTITRANMRLPGPFLGGGGGAGGPPPESNGSTVADGGGMTGSAGPGTGVRTGGTVVAGSVGAGSGDGTGWLGSGAGAGFAAGSVGASGIAVPSVRSFIHCIAGG